MSAAPDFVEPVVGFRAWHLDDDGRLSAWSFDHVWAPGANAAVCLRDARHRAPVASCMCGLYALSDPSDRRLNFSGDQAVGAIAAWGDMEVHRSGFRAEHACVVALATTGMESEARLARLRRAAERYRCALVPARGLSAEAHRHGAPLPADLWNAPAPARRCGPPVPPPLDPDAFTGGVRGLAPAEHLWAETALGALVVGLTPALAAELAPGLHDAVLPSPGDVVAAGDRLATLPGRGGALAAWSPVGGIVAAVNPRLTADPDLLRRDPEGAGWLARLTVPDWDSAGTGLDWHPGAPAAYHAALQATADPFADLRLHFLRAVPQLRGASDVRAALEDARRAPRFGDVAALAAHLDLDAALGRPGVAAALGRLGGRVAWTTTGPDTTLVLDLDAATATWDAPPAGAHVHLRSQADTLVAWAGGTLDVARALRCGDLRADRPAPAALRVLAVLKHLQVRRAPDRGPRL
jgi:glycine cleavage system H protein